MAGAIVGAGILYLTASGQSGFDVNAGFASNGYGEHSPGKYTLLVALVCELVMTFMFLITSSAPPTSERRWALHPSPSASP